MKTTEIRNLSLDEIDLKEKDFKKEMFNLRFQAARGDIQNPKRIGAVRKDVARLLTIKNERKRKNA
ncbi:MAG: 50S ribosomal protein L29 [Nitrospirae bacterium]|nr:50S ribosomal protein L29 [Nitrospirota bacterium]